MSLNPIGVRMSLVRSEFGVIVILRESRVLRAAPEVHMNRPGRRCRTRPSLFTLITRGKEPRLAPAARAPGCAAADADAATATAAAATTATTTAATTATATTAATATAGELNVAVLCRSGAFLVEDIERGEAHIGDFFFTERDLVVGRIVCCLGCVIGRHSCCRRTAYHRKRQASCAQRGQSGLNTLL